MIRCLVVDDEDWARANIKAALTSYDQWQVVTEWSQANDLKTLLAQQPVDVVFLDIQMPGKNGLALAKEWMALHHCPLIIFVTAYDEHAVQAFELATMDYLLKPFSDGRFAQCIQRAEQALHDRQYLQAQSLWLQQQSHPKEDRQRYLNQLVIRSVGNIRLVMMDQVLWFASSGNYVEVHHCEGMHLHRVTLRYLEAQLDPQQFCRVHRGAIVKLSEVRELQNLTEERSQVVLSNGDVVAVSESYKAQLLSALGL